MTATRSFPTVSSFVIAAVVLAFLPAASCSASTSPLARLTLHKRLADTAAPVLQACLPSGEPPCACPRDLNNDTGVLINVYPGYQCAYTGGACTWSDTVRLTHHTTYFRSSSLHYLKQDGSLQNIYQTNCPTVAPCDGGLGSCTCPVDKNGDTGVLINQFRGYQCAYTGGACTWDFVRFIHPPLGLRLKFKLPLFVSSCTNKVHCVTGRRSSEYGADQLSKGCEVCDECLKLLRCTSSRCQHPFSSSSGA